MGAKGEYKGELGSVESNTSATLGWRGERDVRVEDDVDAKDSW
jgi:hypothetical protein